MRPLAKGQQVALLPGWFCQPMRHFFEDIKPTRSPNESKLHIESPRLVQPAMTLNYCFRFESAIRLGPQLSPGEALIKLGLLCELLGSFVSFLWMSVIYCFFSPACGMHWKDTGWSVQQKPLQSCSCLGEVVHIGQWTYCSWWKIYKWREFCSVGYSSIETYFPQ